MANQIETKKELYELSTQLFDFIKQRTKTIIVTLGMKGWIPKKEATALLSWLKLKDM